MQTGRGTLKRAHLDKFCYLKAWLKKILKPKILTYAQVKLENILAVSYPWEVKKIISNLELVLEEMQQEAWSKGLEKGKSEGKLEVARNLLLLLAEKR